MSSLKLKSYRPEKSLPDHSPAVTMKCPASEELSAVKLDTKIKHHEKMRTLKKGILLAAADSRYRRSCDHSSATYSQPGTE